MFSSKIFICNEKKYKDVRVNALDTMGALKMPIFFPFLWDMQNLRTVVIT